MGEELIRFRSRAAISVPTNEMTSISLQAVDPIGSELSAMEGGVEFLTAGWYEVLLTVEWDAMSDAGHRFAHTSIPDAHPLHSEAIEASKLNQISGGKQLLRGNTLFGPDGPSRIELEVWQDSGASITVKAAELAVRRLPRSH